MENRGIYFFCPKKFEMSIYFLEKNLMYSMPEKVEDVKVDKNNSNHLVYFKKKSIANTE